MTTSSRSPDIRLTGLTGTLRACRLFEGLSGEDLATIAGLCHPIALKKGEYLFHEGEVSRGFYVVRGGSINVHRVNAAGKEQVIHVFRAGESLAEAALASPSGYPAEARALEPATVLLIPKAPILDLIGRRPDLAMRMLGAMSAHLRTLVSALEDLTLKDVETRLLNWLLKHGGPGDPVVRLPGTKRVLAAELGTSGETLSRTLARLRELRLISVSAKTITVNDPAALRDMLRRNLGEAPGGA